jgi:hypothetical protein
MRDGSTVQLIVMMLEGLHAHDPGRVVRGRETARAMTAGYAPEVAAGAIA